MVEKQDNALVEETLGGSTGAFEMLVEKYQKVIFNLAYRMTWDYDEAQDITQTAFVRAFENLRRFKPEHKFFSWLYRIAVNEALNRVKAKSKVVPLNPRMRSKEKGPDELQGEKEVSEKIQEALMEIDTKYRVLIILKHFRACSYTEIADALGIPEKKVKSRLFTARQLLRAALETKGVLPDE